jgi:hypothetical protein
MLLSMLAATLAMQIATTPDPILRIDTFGTLPAGRIGAGTVIVDTPHGTGLHFDGSHAGISLPDDDAYKITGSMTIACWIFPTAYTDGNNSSPGAQILFRGDDRSGLDPYHLTLGADHQLTFTVDDGKGGTGQVAEPIDLNVWTHVTASLDNRTGEMEIFKNGVLVDHKTTTVRPFADLSPTDNPGVGIGNVQAAFAGNHNQPFHGKIVDLRLYNVLLPPSHVGSPVPVVPGDGQGPSGGHGLGD